MDNLKTRISLGDTLSTVLMKMSDGNPGAINVLTQIMSSAPTIDPKMLMGGLGYVLLLDTYGVYGPDIWMLYKDVCRQNIVLTMALIRAKQLGIVSNPAMDHTKRFKLADPREFPAIVAALHQEVPKFDISSIANIKP